MVVYLFRPFVPEFTEGFINRPSNKKLLAAEIELRLGLNQQHAKDQLHQPLLALSNCPLSALIFFWERSVL